MIKIKRLMNDEEIHWYVLEVSENIHNELIAFLSELGCEDTLGIDTPFSELAGEYITARGTELKAHFFITNECAHMVLDTSVPQDLLVSHMKKHFMFP